MIGYISNLGIQRHTQLGKESVQGATPPGFPPFPVTIPYYECAKPSTEPADRYISTTVAGLASTIISCGHICLDTEDCFRHTFFEKYSFYNKLP
jgi:hypothetical protein